MSESLSLRDRMKQAICAADCGRVTPNELARCEGLAAAALAAIEASGTHVVVPVEATPAMIDRACIEGIKHTSAGTDTYPAAMYRAFLAYRPKP